MPLFNLKRVWNYCTYNKWFFTFILSLLLLSSLIQDYLKTSNVITWVLTQFIVTVVVFGYGMEITRDRANHGVRLPKIKIINIISLGFKSYIVMLVYMFVQGYVLDFICSPLNFPRFNLEEMILKFPETIHSLYSHNPVEALIFLVIGGILFYITAFFTEIALARLADTKSLWAAFNLIAIKRSIDAFGWRRYTKDYTLIIFTLVILSYIKSLLPVSFEGSLLDIVFGFLIFATQYLGIGAVYCEIKDVECGRK